MVKSSLPDVEIPHITLPQAIFKQFDEFSDDVAIICGESGRSYTFRQIRDYSRRVASGLARRGVKKGDVVAILLPNIPEFAFIFYGILQAGAIVSTVNPMYTVPEIAHQLVDCGAQYVFTVGAGDMDKHAKEATKRAGVKVKEIFVVGQSEGCIPVMELVMDDGSAFPHHVTYDVKNDVAVIPYSSGTTGLPKGVMLTHYNVVANIIQCDQPELKDPALPHNHKEVILAFIPFFHSYGLFVILGSALAKGHNIITLPRFVPEVFLKAIEKHKITVMPVVPPVIVFLAKSPLVLKYDLSSVRKVGSGAAPLSKEIEDEFRRRISGIDKLTQGYGLTETSPVVSTTGYASNGELLYKPGCSGILLRNTEMQIVDLFTHKVLGPMERGEIWVRGPQVMKGYLNNAKATKEIIDEQGWLHTGDVGCYDEDGLIYIVDRIKELIKYKGFQVAPAELEALLLTHPGIADVGVIGIPDVEAGELPRAYLVKKPGHNVTEKDIKDFMEENAAHYKHLRGGIVFTDSIPKTLSGKILRKELKALAAKSKL